MTEETADAIFVILAEHAGAREYMHDKFVHDLTYGCTEFIVGGGLGFGGKLYVELDGLRVVSYLPTRTHDEVVEKTNAALAALGEEF